MIMHAPLLPPPLRALLQLSALYQHTHNTSDLLCCMLRFLQTHLSQLLTTTTITRAEKKREKGAAPLFSPPSPAHLTAPLLQDQLMLQWMIMLLTHFLSSTLLSTSSHNLFVPLPVRPLSLLPRPVESTVAAAGAAGASATELEKKHVEQVRVCFVL